MASNPLFAPAPSRPQISQQAPAAGAPSSAGVSSVAQQSNKTMSASRVEQIPVVMTNLKSSMMNIMKHILSIMDQEEKATTAGAYADRGVSSYHSSQELGKALEEFDISCDSLYTMTMQVRNDLLTRLPRTFQDFPPSASSLESSPTAHSSYSSASSSSSSFQPSSATSSNSFNTSSFVGLIPATSTPDSAHHTPADGSSSLMGAAPPSAASLDGDTPMLDADRLPLSQQTSSSIISSSMPSVLQFTSSSSSVAGLVSGDMSVKNLLDSFIKELGSTTSS